MKNADQNPRPVASYRLKTVPFEKSIVSAHHKIENAVVSAYQSVEDRFVERFLEPTGETPDVARADDPADARPDDER